MSANGEDDGRSQVQRTVRGRMLDDGRSEVHRTVLARMLDDLAHGRFEAGARLPPESDLAQEFGVSRGVLREVLRSLADRGVVAIRHGYGTWVNAASEWDMLDGAVLAAVMPTPASVVVLTDYLECRRILEIEAAALAADRASSTDLSQMADAIAQMQDLADGATPEPSVSSAFHAADIAFHGAIFAASGNQVLPRIVEPIQRAMATLRPHLALAPEERVRKTLPEHHAIFTAIADHDPAGARAAMAAHLATVGEALHNYRLHVSDTDAVSRP